MTETFLQWLMQKIADGHADDFYRTYEWKTLSPAVRKMDRNECQKCKARGKYRRAELVHHVNHVKDRPDLALDIWYTAPDGTRQRNLISICKRCHEEEHPEQLQQLPKSEAFSTPERWD